MHPPACPALLCLRRCAGNIMGPAGETIKAIGYRTGERKIFVISRAGPGGLCFLCL